MKLAGQLPWLLHLLLLTDCARLEGGDAPGSSYGSACDDDSAARSEGTNHGGVPSGSGREGTLSADHASSGGPMGFPPRGRQNRESANFSIMSTSEPASGVDSEVCEILPGKSRGRCPMQLSLLMPTALEIS